ncbi:VOC family protein [Candidatus Leptofilum sp.]|uniref:VOC family protein n=1 Tax=Candidatus Leptofilum sp. TaxID=3241576 RepID=UPI003B5C1398
MKITRLDHVQLAMPPGGEEQARAFYGRILNLRELEKPEPLQAKGGCWFAGEGLELHLGVQADFVPATKAHPGLRVADLEAVQAHLQAAGIPIVADTSGVRVRRFYVNDPFGNRLEFMQEGDSF